MVARASRQGLAELGRSQACAVCFITHRSRRSRPIDRSSTTRARRPSHCKMADLLGSILNSMEKPPTVGDQESRRKARGMGRFVIQK